MSRSFAQEILVHSTAEFLAKIDEYSQPGLDYYLDQAARLHAGDKLDVDEELAATIGLHELMLNDEEDEALRKFPDLLPRFRRADERQNLATSGTKNLRYFSENGVEYEFDEAQAERVAQLVELGRPLTELFMRENIVSASGYKNVRLNYIYHDVMDHVWLFNFMKEHGLDERYRDYLEKIGDPFNGTLMSREAELISGIGFTSRRYLSNTAYYDRMSLDRQSVVEFLRDKGEESDERIAQAIDIMLRDPETAQMAGFVIKDTIANIIAQRGKSGPVKNMVKDEDGNYVSTGNPSQLLDPVYVALIIETVAELIQSTDEYIAAQVKLNLLIEKELMRYVSTGRAAGSLSLDQTLEVHEIPAANLAILQTDIGLSTSYFGK